MDTGRSTTRWGALFRDRVDAGVQLAAALDGYRGQDVLVLGIPRGGVVVAAEVARRLGAELDVIVARKLGAPISRELAIGAVTADGQRYLNEDILRELRVSERYLQTVTEEEQAEARRREEQLRAGRPPARIAGRTVILIDDGLATGATMRAAVRSVRRQEPARLVVAVPVGARETCEELRAEADEVVCLYQPEPFWAVGAHYQRFEPVDDATVQALLRAFAPATHEPE
ncbi:MAG: phosphoribosyl transferase [Chloroflexota bacterium]